MRVGGAGGAAELSPDWVPGIGIQVVDAPLGLVKVLPGPVDLELHEVDPAVVDLAGGAVEEPLQNLALLDVEGLDVLHGDVDAVALVDVLTDIAKDVCELVGGPEGQGRAVDGFKVALEQSTRGSSQRKFREGRLRVF